MTKLQGIILALTMKKEGWQQIHHKGEGNIVIDYNYIFCGGPHKSCPVDCTGVVVKLEKQKEDVPLCSHKSYWKKGERNE